MRRHGHSCGLKQGLGELFVHAGCAGEDAVADVREVEEFEEALDRAVFAIGSVQNGEDDVDVAGRFTVDLDHPVR